MSRASTAPSGWASRPAETRAECLLAVRLLPLSLPAHPHRQSGLRFQFRAPRQPRPTVTRLTNQMRCDMAHLNNESVSLHAFIYHSIQSYMYLSVLSMLFILFVNFDKFLNLESLKGITLDERWISFISLLISGSGLKKILYKIVLASFMQIKT